MSDYINTSLQPPSGARMSWDAMDDPAESSFAAPAGSAAWCVITELEGLKAWIKDGSGYIRDDAPDEIARAIDNRIREIKSSMTEAPPN